jgi:TonB family protein
MIEASQTRKYLLGQLSEEQQSRVEECLFTDAEFLEEVELAEDDLIEAYVCGKLSSVERRQFETHFLTTPERRRHLEVTRTLRGVFGEESTREESTHESDRRRRISWPFNWFSSSTGTPMFGLWAASASFVLFLVVAGYLAVRMSQQGEVANRQLAARDARIRELENQLGVGSGKGGGVYRVGGGVTAPALLSRVDPEYSEEARKAKYQGAVLLNIEVDPSGKVTNIKVQRSLGLGLDEKAIEAVRKWRFKPGYKDGKPVTVTVSIEVDFRLQ